MRTIWKFPLDKVGYNHITVPVKHEILTVADQHGTPTIWASVFPGDSMIMREVMVVGTGMEEPNRDEFYYIGTAVGSSFVWHVYLRGAL